MLNRLAFGLVLGLAAVSTVAQNFSDIQANPASGAYLQDSRGIILRSGSGLCWRSGNWASADATSGCDGTLAPPIANPTAPAIATPPTAQTAIAPLTTERCDFTVDLSSDQAFAFNKAILNAPAKKRIEEEVLPRLSRCAKLDAILITGHTDRLGSSPHNQQLSEKRAGAVAAYLKSKGITAPVSIFGAGKTQPLKACAGKLSRRGLIECLSPNRRVVIDVRGTAQ